MKNYASYRTKKENKDNIKVGTEVTFSTHSETINHLVKTRASPKPQTFLILNPPHPSYPISDSSNHLPNHLPNQSPNHPVSQSNQTKSPHQHPSIPLPQPTAHPQRNHQFPSFSQSNITQYTTTPPISISISISISVSFIHPFNAFIHSLSYSLL